MYQGFISCVSVCEQLSVLSHCSHCTAYDHVQLSVRYTNADSVWMSGVHLNEIWWKHLADEVHQGVWCCHIPALHLRVPLQTNVKIYFISASNKRSQKKQDTLDCFLVSAKLVASLSTCSASILLHILPPFWQYTGQLKTIHMFVLAIIIVLT